MKRYLSILATFAVALILAESCQNKQDRGAVGYVSFSMGLDVSVDKVFTKAAESQVFSLDIYDAEQQLVRSYADINEIVETPLELRVGTYKAVAGTAKGSAAFDAPSYAGEAEFRIIPSQNQDVNIVCTLSNVMVTAAFDKTITDVFSEYSLTVSDGTSSLVFSNIDGTVSRKAYFPVADHLSWTLRLVNNDGEVYETLHDTYTGIKARQHYNLSFSLQEKEVFGGGAFEIVLDNTYNEKSYELILDFDAKNYPDIRSEVFEFSSMNTVYEALDVDGRIFFRFDKGLSSVRISHESAELDRIGLARSNEFIGLDQTAADAFAQKGIVVPVIAAGAVEVVADLSGFLKQLPKGTFRLILSATSSDGKEKTENFDFTVKPGAPVEVVEIIPWAMYATVKGLWYSEEQPQGISFQYKGKDSTSWIEVDPADVKVDAASKTYTADLFHLLPGNSYEVKAVTVTAKQSVIKTFTADTETGTVPNMGFDDWNKSGKSWYPNKSGAAWTWDTANEGANTNPFAETNPTVPERNDLAVKGEGKAAARMESTTVVGNFTAGNIYTGDFGKAVISPTAGANLSWGVPFTSRPYALKGWYKYSPKTIDYAQGPYSGMKGKTDQMNIQVLLTDWKEPFRIDTAAGRFVNVETDPGIIAYGTVVCAENTGGYVEFTLPLEYRDVHRKPTYVVIAACASRFGDYFTGAVGSVLLVDEFSFVYDPTETVQNK